MSLRYFAAITAFIFAALPLAGLPVSLGMIEIGLESFDGYQEGMAYVSTNEDGTALELLIQYKGFGLDTVSWMFPESDLGVLREKTFQAVWWRSRLLEIDVSQTVSREMASATPILTYAYRGNTYPFESTENSLSFVRQGKDYALLLSESSPGAETRRSGNKTLPIFTVHFSGRELPNLRDILSEDYMNNTLTAYAEQKNTIETILNTTPN